MARQEPEGFGVVFDVDGVLYTGGKALPGAAEALATCYKAASGARSPENARFPHVFLTNSGGYLASNKVAHLNTVLGGGFELTPRAMVTSHTPVGDAICAGGLAADDRVLVVGAGESLACAGELGFRNITGLEAYLSRNPLLVPLSPTSMKARGVSADNDEHAGARVDALPTTCNETPIKAVLVLREPKDWQAAIQVICDVAQSAVGVPGREVLPRGAAPVIPVHVANGDVVYKGLFETPRLTNGAFIAAMRAVFSAVQGAELDVRVYGKPKRVSFECARTRLNEMAARAKHPPPARVYMIGDNPLSDIRGARAAGPDWTAILVRTGNFQSPDANDADNPADHVCADVTEALAKVAALENLPPS